MGTSYQRGSVSLRGKKWYGYLRRTILDPETQQPKTISSPVALGLKGEMTKLQAREKLVAETTRLSGQVTEDGSVKNGLSSSVGRSQTLSATEGGGLERRDGQDQEVSDSG